MTCTIPAGLAVSATSNFIIPITPTAAAAANVTNTAIVNGGGDSGCPAASRCSSFVTTPVDPAPTASLTLNKTSAVADSNGDTVTGDAGDVITYSFAVTNTGTLALVNVVVSDPLLPTLSRTIANLAVGATTSCVATNNTYTITAGDVLPVVVRIRPRPMRTMSARST